MFGRKQQCSAMRSSVSTTPPFGRLSRPTRVHATVADAAPSSSERYGGARRPHAIDVYVVHHCEEPRPQIGAGLPERPLAPRPFERVLDQVVGGFALPGQCKGIAPQARNAAFRVCRAEARACHVVRSCARSRHALLKPSPVRSPGLLSLIHRYSGLPL